MSDNNISFIKAIPTIKNLFEVRAIARSTLSQYPFFKQIKVLLATSYFSLLFSKFLNNTFFFVVKNKKTIGFAILKNNRVRGLFVLDIEQRCGYGGMLLNFIEEDLLSRGFRLIILKPCDNTFFYKKRGYTPLSPSGKLMFKPLHLTGDARVRELMENLVKDIYGVKK